MSRRNGNHARKPRKHKKKNLLLRLLIIACLIGAGALVWNLDYFGISNIAVIGNRTVSDDDILEMSGVREGDSIFSVRPLLVSHRLKENLYIRKVNVDRVLPGTVKLIVTERLAEAQFKKETKKKSGKETETETRYIITDIDGLVLEKSKKKKHVTLVENVTVTGSEEGSRIKVKEHSIYEKALSLISCAKESDLYFKKISISGSHVEAWIFDDLVCKGRYANIVKSMETGELKTVVYRLYQQDVDEGTINIGDNNYCSFTP